MTTESIAERRVAILARQLDAQLVQMAQRVNAPVKELPSGWMLTAGAAAVGFFLMPAKWRRRIMAVAGHAALSRLGVPLL